MDITNLEGRIRSTAQKLDSTGRPDAVEAINWDPHYRRHLSTKWTRQPSGVFGWEVGEACWLEYVRGERRPRFRPTFVATDGTIYRRRPLDDETDDSPHCRWEEESSTNAMGGMSSGVLPKKNLSRLESLTRIAARLDAIATAHGVSIPI
jgi:hypothetical protein